MYPRLASEDLEYYIRNTIMSCVQEKRRSAKRALRKKNKNLAPAKRGRPPKVDSLRKQLAGHLPCSLQPCMRQLGEPRPEIMADRFHIDERQEDEESDADDQEDDEEEEQD